MISKPKSKDLRRSLNDLQAEIQAAPGDASTISKTRLSISRASLNDLESAIGRVMKHGCSGGGTNNGQRIAARDETISALDLQDAVQHQIDDVIEGFRFLQHRFIETRRRGLPRHRFQIHRQRRPSQPDTS